MLCGDVNSTGDKRDEEMCSSVFNEQLRWKDGACCCCGASIISWAIFLRPTSGCPFVRPAQGLRSRGGGGGRGEGRKRQFHCKSAVEIEINFVLFESPYARSTISTPTPKKIKGYSRHFCRQNLNQSSLFTNHFSADARGENLNKLVDCVFVYEGGGFIMTRVKSTACRKWP